MSLKWRTFDHEVDLNDAAAGFILSCAQSAILSRQRFSLVMAGGRSPAVVYRMLRHAETDWSCWHIYFTDERCVDRDDPERNSRMVRDCLVDHVPMPASHIHDIPTELGVDAAAVRYTTLVQAEVPFDLVLLGVGEDGHTASLFPGQTMDPGAWTVAVRSAPKPPHLRVSLGLLALRSTADVLVMGSGAGKRDVIKAWRRGAPLPIAIATAGLRGWVMTDCPLDED